jgi:hypothetical protein
MKSVMIFCLLLFSFVLYNCSDDPAGPGDGSSVKIYMVDSPAEYDEVNIVIEKVEVGRDSSGQKEWTVISNETKTYNLLELRNGNVVLIGDATVSSGHYSYLRLTIGASSNVVINGIPFVLLLQGGLHATIEIVHEFDVTEDASYEMMIDFDAEKSIISGSGTYSLRPTIRVIQSDLSGFISGKVLPSGDSPAIFAISGSDTATTSADEDGNFKVMALHEGTFNVYIKPNEPSYRDTAVEGFSFK